MPISTDACGMLRLQIVFLIMSGFFLKPIDALVVEPRIGSIVGLSISPGNEQASCSTVLKNISDNPLS